MDKQDKNLKKILNAFLLTLIFISQFSCSIFHVEPDIKKNYQIQVLNKSRWEPSMAQAEQSIYIEEPTLRTSNNKKIVRWREQLNSLMNKPPLEQLEWVNFYINKDVNYLTDYEHWKKSDVWGFPLETLETGGDCEDIALLKMVSLQYLGWDDEQLMILVGLSNFGSPPKSHAILMVTLKDGSQLLLDSLETGIFPPSEDHHFKPAIGVTKYHSYSVKLNELK